MTEETNSKENWREIENIVVKKTMIWKEILMQDVIKAMQRYINSSSTKWDMFLPSLDLLFTPKLSNSSIASTCFFIFFPISL